MRTLAVPEDRDEFIRDSQHFRAVFAAAADADAAYCVARDREVAAMSREHQMMVKRVCLGAAFEKWLGSERDAPDGGQSDTLVFSHGSMAYVRGCCAALESLTPASDVGAVTIVKKLLDAGLADVCLTSTVSLPNCVLSVLRVACHATSSYIVARLAALVACASLSLQELADVLTLDSGAVAELDASVTSCVLACSLAHCYNVTL